MTRCDAGQRIASSILAAIGIVLAPTGWTTAAVDTQVVGFAEPPMVDVDLLITSDGATLVVPTAGGFLHLVDVSTGAVLADVAIDLPVPGVDPLLTGDDARVYLPVASGVIHQIELATGLRTDITAGVPVEDVDALLTPDESRLVLQAGDGALYVIDTATGTVVSTVTVGVPLPAVDPVLSGDGGTVYTLSRTGEVRAVDLAAGTVLWTVAVGEISAEVDMTLSTDGSKLLIAENTGTFRAIDAASASTVGILSYDQPDAEGGTTQQGVDLLLSPLADHSLLAGRHGELFVIDHSAATPVLVASTGFTDEIQIGIDPVATPDGKRTLLAGNNGTLSIVDTDPISSGYGTALATVAIDEPFQESVDLAVSPDGTEAYLVTGAGALEIVDIDPTSPGFGSVRARVPFSGELQTDVDMVHVAGGAGALLGSSGSVLLLRGLPADALVVVTRSTDNLSSEVHLIDPASAALLETVSFGEGLWTGGDLVATDPVAQPAGCPSCDPDDDWTNLGLAFHMTPCTDCLYLNGWFDWNGDGAWSPDEHEIHALISDPPVMGDHASLHSGFQLFKVAGSTPGLISGHGDRDGDGLDNINDRDEIRVEHPLESKSPYLHWDLREFRCTDGELLGCRVPFTLNENGTTDLPLAKVRETLDAALAALSVSAITPYRTPQTTPATVAQDETNTIGFQTRAQLAALGVAISKNTAGVACIYWSETGVIHEVDVVLNEGMTFGTTGTGGGEVDLQALLMHEVGHGLGMAHCNVPAGALSPLDCRVMHTPLLPGTDQRKPGLSDIRALDFLYFWDQGDAPDPFLGVANAYPTRVRLAPDDGRVLSGVALSAPKRGAVHMYPQIYRLGPLPFLDDGVAIPPLEPGTTVTVTARVVTFDGDASVSRDYGYSVTVPPTVAPQYFSRFRLDIGEDAGQVAVVQDVALETGLAQYGEVEDYAHGRSGYTSYDIDSRVELDESGGPDDVIVRWVQIPQLQRYNVYQSSAPNHGFEPLPVPSCDLFQQDAIAFPAPVAPGQALFFLVGGITDDNNETSLGLIHHPRSVPPPYVDLRDDQFANYVAAPCLP